MPVQLEEGLVRYGFTGLLLRPHVDSRQQMVLHAFYLAIRHRLELTQGTEIEDAAEVILRLQPRHIGIGSIVQMGSAQQTMRTDSPSTRRRYATQVTGVIYMFEDDFQFSIFKDFIYQTHEFLISEGVGEVGEGRGETAVMPLVGRFVFDMEDIP